MSTTTVSQLSFGSVINPVGGSLGDGSQTPMVAGRGGDHLVSEVHGRFYQMAYRGNVFHARSPVAGSVIPVNSATTQVFAVLNPAGSGVNLEILQARVDISATSTYVAAEIYLNAVNGTPLAVILGGTCTVISGGVQNCFALQGNTAKSIAYSAVTSVSQADKHVCGLGSFDAVSTGNNRNLIRNFDGGMIIPQGTIIFVTGTAAQTSIAHVEFMYAEVPA